MDTKKHRRRMTPAALSACLVAICLAALAGPAVSLAASGGTTVVSNFDGSRFDLRLRISFPEDALSLGRSGIYDTVHLEDCSYTCETGMPRLPIRTLRVALPDGMRVTGVRVLDRRAIEIPGRYTVVPAQPPRPITDAIEPRAFVGPDAATYASPEIYPPEAAVLLGQTDLAGQNIAVLEVHPVRYRADLGTLTFAHLIEVELTGVPGRACDDYLPEAASARTAAAYERMLAGMVVNPEDVELVTYPVGSKGSRGVGPGQYDYVIVTHANWVSSFQPLADWRTKQGTPAAIVTTDWILTSGGYSGTNLEKFRAFVIDAHANWGSTDFLLGADTHVIPYHVRTITVPDYSTDDIANDTYYADYDEDWVCEVNVGRASVRSTTEIGQFIAKVLAYEKTPPLTDYVETAVFFGMDISTCGDMYGENHKENYIRAMHLPGDWALDTEYDSEAGTHKADILAYLQEGHHLVNHHDHCNSDCMGTGWICHSSLMYTSDIEALTNGARQSIGFAVGCYPAHIPTYRSIGEAFVLNPGGGGVAFMGNTCIGWGGSSEDSDYYSIRQDRYFYRNLFDLDIRRLGENFTRLKNDEFDPVDPYNLHQYCFTQLHLLGDPGMTIWTEDPQALSVTHFESLVVGDPATFPVQVSSGRAPVDSATVCLWKDGDLYEVGQTSGGGVTFNFTPASQGTLYVTVCHRNCLPYEGYAVVSTATSVAGATGGIPDRLEIVSIRPNPFNPAAEIAYAIPASSEPSDVRLSVLNALGQRVRVLVDGEASPGVHRASWDGRDQAGREVASGVYFCELRWRREVETRRMVLLK